MGCFPSTLKDQKDGHDKLSDTSSTHSDGKTDSTATQVNFNHRQESEDEGQAPNQPCDDPPSPRTAFAERLWAYWHETECSDIANCTHSFYAVYMSSPTRFNAPRSAGSDSCYTLRGSKANSNRSSRNPQPFEFDGRTSSISAIRNRATDVVSTKPPVVVLRRTWSESECRTTAPLPKSRPHTA